MPLLIEISDEVLDALRLPREEVDGELRAELAAVLYARGALSLGKATEMARLSRWAFEDLLAKRNIVRNYSEDDLRHDLAWRRPDDVAQAG
jgi:predicted HTH domain antitoxin